MEEFLERQLLIRGHAFVTFSTIEKALAGRKKSFRGSHAVQACSKPIISSKTLNHHVTSGLLKRYNASYWTTFKHRGKPCLYF